MDNQILELITMQAEIDGGGGTTADFWKIFHPRTFISNPPPFNEIFEILTEKLAENGVFGRIFLKFPPPAVILTIYFHKNLVVVH